MVRDRDDLLVWRLWTSFKGYRRKDREKGRCKETEMTERERETERSMEESFFWPPSPRTSLQERKREGVCTISIEGTLQCFRKTLSHSVSLTTFLYSFCRRRSCERGWGSPQWAGRNGCAFDRFESTMSPKGFPRRISVEGDLKSSLRFYFERRRNEKTIGLINKHIAALMSKRKFNMGGSPYLGGLICITILRPGFECKAHHLCFFQIVLL